MTVPRALRFPVMAMARPSRPLAEVQAVHAAADLLRAETGIGSAHGLGRMIAGRVIDLLLDDTRNDLAASLLPLAGDPVAALAFGEGFGAVDDLASRYWDRVMATFGIQIAPEFQQAALRRAAARDMIPTLAERYARQLRSLNYRGRAAPP